MASNANVLSLPEARRGPPEAPRRPRWNWLQLLRDALGGALLLAVWLALWTVTWAAVAGPLSPARGGGGAAASAETRT